MNSETFQPRVTPWQIEESDFYELNSFREQVDFLLRYAVLAPSSHNTQPWMFRIRPDGVEVMADYSRRLTLVDPDDRELLMSVGAAIMNLRVAAAWFGFETTVTYESRPEQTLPVAFVAIRETCAPDEELRSLFPAIRKRHTSRQPFTGGLVSGDVISVLCDFLDEYPDTLRILRPQDRPWVGDLVAEGDRQQMARPALRSELADWLRPAESEREDGICSDSLGIHGPFAATDWVLRNMNIGDSQARRDLQRLGDAAALIIVTAPDDRVSLIKAGEVLERLLLTITREGIQYSFLNQPIEVPELRAKLQELARTTQPLQLLLRIGYAKESVRPAPRRPVEAVIAK